MEETNKIVFPIARVPIAYCLVSEETRKRRGKPEFKIKHTID